MEINEIELASNLAHDRTAFELISNEILNNKDEMYKNINAETLEYTEDVQITFNEWYDYYLTKIENTKLTTD